MTSQPTLALAATALTAAYLHFGGKVYGEVSLSTWLTALAVYWLYVAGAFSLSW